VFSGLSQVHSLTTESPSEFGGEGNYEPVRVTIVNPPFPPPDKTAISSPETRLFGMSTTSVQSVRQAYRLLYKAGLAAVQYSVPNRYCVRDKLRKAFRSAPASQYNQRRIDNTTQFLWSAAEKRGMEHKIVKNLCLVHYYQIAYRKKRPVHRGQDVEETAYNGYLENLGLMNESMDLDLR